jgi:hypothetical protein
MKLDFLKESDDQLYTISDGSSIDHPEQTDSDIHVHVLPGVTSLEQIPIEKIFTENAGKPAGRIICIDLTKSNVANLRGIPASIFSKNDWAVTDTPYLYVGESLRTFEGLPNGVHCDIGMSGKLNVHNLKGLENIHPRVLYLNESITDIESYFPKTDALVYLGIPGTKEIIWQLHDTITDNKI